MKEGYLGIDVGSISTNLAVVDGQGELLCKKYIRTRGRPVEMMQKGLVDLADELDPTVRIRGVGATGSGRQLAGILAGADVVKNEITAHAVAALHVAPDTRTVIEIGGQDSKCIFFRDGMVIDFAMNTVCAAGTGSFLDQQAHRLGIPVNRFGQYALKARRPVKVAGRCTVFAESDMIHKQQMGHRVEDIIAGLCEALVRNYLNNLVKSHELYEPILFQGGVAANEGMRAAFEKLLGKSLIIPPHYEVMGAVGAALLAREEADSGRKTRFRGFEIGRMPYELGGFECEGCSNCCEVMEVRIPQPGGKERLVRWGDRCGKWETGAD